MHPFLVLLFVRLPNNAASLVSVIRKYYNFKNPLSFTYSWMASSKMLVCVELWAL